MTTLIESPFRRLPSSAQSASCESRSSATRYDRQTGAGKRRVDLHRRVRRRTIVSGRAPLATTPVAPPSACGDSARQRVPSAALASDLGHHRTHRVQGRHPCSRSLKDFDHFVEIMVTICPLPGAERLYGSLSGGHIGDRLADRLAGAKTVKRPCAVSRHCRTIESEMDAGASRKSFELPPRLTVNNRSLPDTGRIAQRSKAKATLYVPYLVFSFCFASSHKASFTSVPRSIADTVLTRH